MARFRDFDAQFAQMRQETIRIRVYGKDYEFPAVIPAYIPLEMARYADSGEAGIPNGVVLGAARVMFGEDAIREWSSHADFDMVKMGTIIREAFEMISGAPDEDEGATEDDAAPLG